MLAQFSTEKEHDEHKTMGENGNEKSEKKSCGCGCGVAPLSSSSFATILLCFSFCVISFFKRAGTWSVGQYFTAYKKSFKTSIHTVVCMCCAYYSILNRFNFQHNCTKNFCRIFIWFGRTICGRISCPKFEIIFFVNANDSLDFDYQTKLSKNDK